MIKIRMWDFDNGELLKILIVSSSPLISICLWKNDFLVISDDKKNIILIELNTGFKIKSFNYINDKHSKIFILKTIIHPSYGECLITQNTDGKITIWHE